MTRTESTGFKAELVTYGLPPELWEGPFATCFFVEITDSLVPGVNWVNLADKFFETAGVSPKRGYAISSRLLGNSKDNIETSGSWSRIRKKAAHISSIVNNNNALDVQTDYKYIPGELPNDAYFLVKRTKPMQCVIYTICIVICNSLFQKKLDVLYFLTKHYVDQFHWSGGGIFQFPEKAGASFYLGGSMSYVPKKTKELGNSVILLRHYVSRFNRPRIRINSGYLYSRGYMREVYDQNFLSPAHMAAPLLGGTVMDYVKQTGTLEKLDLPYDLWLWSLNPDDHAKACLDWEESGLVLAAEREPIDLCQHA